MGNKVDFGEWKQDNNAFISNNVEMTEGKKSKWGKINCKWEEKSEIPSDKTENQIDQIYTKNLDHIYKSTVDLKTGDFYLDCSKKKIWAKSLTYSFVQPILLTVKTVYHLLLPLSIPFEIFKEVQKIKEEEKDNKKPIGKKETTVRVVKAIGKNLVDIVRTPLYAIALTIIGIAGVIIGPFAPKILYDVRATAGKVEKALHRGDESSNWIIFQCFQPLGNLATIDQEWQSDKHDTVYPKADVKKDEERLRGLSNIARALIKFRRNHRALFNDCFRKFPANTPYKS